MKICSYIVKRDFGFAPNPFPPCCTLATCKPDIRRNAKIGDWITGIGSGARGSQFKNMLIYAMRVSEKLTYDEYWEDPRFKRKRPTMNGSKKQMYGDNIYHRPDPESPFMQENSHHSLTNGDINIRNYKRDLAGKSVLISDKYWYFGKDAIPIPHDLLEIANIRRGYKGFDDESFQNRVLEWLYTLPEDGCLGRPLMFDKDFARYSGK